MSECHDDSCAQFGCWCNGAGRPCRKCGREIGHLPSSSCTSDGGETWDGPKCYPSCPSDFTAKRSDEWTDERADVLGRFADELAKATGDGSKKRQAGTKPPWYEDDSHEAAMFSHLMKWKRGEMTDADSGAHPLVHLAWRALAIACKESGNIPAS